MRPLFLIPAALCLAACEVENNQSTISAQGVTSIQFQDGRNCWNNRCLDYSSRNNVVTLAGRNSVSVPSDINAADGSVTEAEFNRMFERAGRATARGSGISGGR